MSPEMLARILEIGPKFQDWFKDVEKYAKAVMINQGVKLPGFKIVRGRSSRIITDKEKIAEILRTNGYDEEAYMKPSELLSLTNLEKNVGKKTFDRLVGEKQQKVKCYSRC